MKFNIFTVLINGAGEPILDINDYIVSHYIIGNAIAFHVSI